MSNLETMQKGIDFTTEKFINQNNHNPNFANMNDAEMQWQGIVYSGMILENIVRGTTINGQSPLSAYTRQGNLRGEISALSADSIKNELLKNAVNVASWHKLRDSRAANRISAGFTANMTDDEIAVVLSNIVEQYGVQTGYEVLNDPQILSSACRTFASYRRSKDFTQIRGYANNGDGRLTPVYGENPIRNQLDVISKTDERAVRLNNELDVHYARYGARPQGMDASNLGSYGYDANSGYGRR